MRFSQSLKFRFSIVIKCLLGEWDLSGNLFTISLMLLRESFMDDVTKQSNSH